MKPCIRLISGIVALLLSAALWAQGMTAGSVPLSKQQINEQHRDAMKKCDALQDNAKRICETEADGKKSIAEAQAKVMQRDSPKNRLALAEARAEALYKVNRLNCEDQVGDAKDACNKNARSQRDMSLAQARRESQTQTRAPGGETSTGGGGLQEYSPATGTAPAAPQN